MTQAIVARNTLEIQKQPISVPNNSPATGFEKVSSRLKKIKHDYDYQTISQSYPESRFLFDSETHESDGKQLSEFVLGSLQKTKSIKQFGHLMMYAFDKSTVGRIQEYDQNTDVFEAKQEPALFNGGSYAIAATKSLVDYAERRPAKHFLATKLWRDAWVPFAQNSAKVESSIMKIVTSGVSASLKGEISQRAPWHEDMPIAEYAGLNTAVYAREVIQAQRRGISAPMDVLHIQAPFTHPAMIK